MTPPATLAAGTATWRRMAAAVFRHELRALAHAPMTPVLLAGFLLALMAGVFTVGEFYASDRTAADLLWTFLPWAAVVFVPALAMRAYVDDQGDRSLELVRALPLDDSAVVAGKWAAGVVLLATMLAGTAPFVATLAYIGDPDWGALAVGMAGALMLLAALLALAHAAAAWTRDQTGGYVAGVTVLLAVLLAATEGVQRQLAGTPLAIAAEAFAALGPKPWLDRMATGRIEAGALISFLVLGSTSLALAWQAMIHRRQRRLPGRSNRRGWNVAALVIGLALATSAASTRWPPLVDLSAGRAFSLHPESIAAARAVQPGTRIDFYWSADETRVPAAIRSHALRIRTLLEQLSARSRGHLALTAHDVLPESEAEAQAQAAGVKRIPMSSGDSFVLGAVFRHGERQGAISYFDIRREGLVEYDIALALTTLGRARTPRLGILSPLVAPRHAGEPREGLAVLDELKRTYDVAIVPHFADTLPDDLDALLVVGASVLKRSMLYAIDQHVMRGKGLVVLVDPYTRFDSASNAVVPRPSDEIDDISDLLLRYGVRFEPDGVVGDASLAAEVTASDERRIVYPFWLRLGRSQLSSRHATTASLNEVLLAEPGAFTIVRPDAATPLAVTSGAGTGALARKLAAGLSTEALAARFEADGRERLVAAALSGPFVSAFETAPADAADTGKSRHLARSDPPAAVFAVADIDFIFDPLALQNVVAGARSHTRPLNDNIAFLANLVEAATGDPRLLSIRSRGTMQRPFTTVSRLLAAAQARHRDEEARLVGAIARVEGDIRKIVEVAQVDDVSALPLPVRRQIAELSRALLPYRQELRRIRFDMRQDIERLGRRLTLLNLASGPLVALGFAWAAAARRRRRHARAHE